MPAAIASPQPPDFDVARAVGGAQFLVGGQIRADFLSPLLLIFWVGGAFAVAAMSHHLFETPAQNVIRALWWARTQKIATSFA